MSKENLSIFLLLCSLSYAIADDPYPYLNKINLPSDDFGPESVALDRYGGGPYDATSDGLVRKYEGTIIGFTDFAYTNPNRTKQECDGVRDPDLGPKCGRIYGLSFYNANGDLYMVDAFDGVFVVGEKGGLATFLFNTAEGVRLNFPNGIDVDQRNADVYVTDGSLTYGLREISSGNFTPDSSGRLIKWNSKTKEVTVLLKNLPNPIGPAVSPDGTSVLFSEVGAKRISIFYLTGPKANTKEVLFSVPGFPLKVKRATNPGEFWVPESVVSGQPPLFQPTAYKFNSSGSVLIKKDLQAQYYNDTVNVFFFFFKTPHLGACPDSNPGPSAVPPKRQYRWAKGPLVCQRDTRVLQWRKIIRWLPTF